MSVVGEHHAPFLTSVPLPLSRLIVFDETRSDFLRRNNPYTQQPAQTVVQRAYNAFAVRVLDEEGKRRVVPALESSEGVLCVEMMIRLYRDGLMSGLLAQLIKVRLVGWSTTTGQTKIVDLWGKRRFG